VASYIVFRITSGLFLDATAVQIDTCRLAALMVEPEMFTYLVEKSDPGQGRVHSDNPNLRAQALASNCMKKLTAMHNDVNFVPTATCDVTDYAPHFFLTIAQPAEQRDFGWISTTFQGIKTQMGIFLGNFNKSGDLENDLNDSVRDAKFWTQFSNKQPMWYVILLIFS
jgi:hypothetical protein